MSKCDNVIMNTKLNTNDRYESNISSSEQINYDKLYFAMFVDIKSTQLIYCNLK